MGKIFVLILIVVINLSGDSMDGLKKEIREKHVIVNDSKLINDKTCSEDDIKKIIKVSDDILHNRESNPFYTDLCKPYKKAYNLMVKENDEFTFTKFNKLIQEYKESEYIHFFAFLYNKNLPNGINKTLYQNKDDEISKYMNFYFNRPYRDEVRRLPVNFPKHMYEEGNSFLSSTLDIIFVQAEKEALIYLRKNKDKTKIKNFLISIIKKRKTRGLTNEDEYLELANILFEENKFKIINNSRNKIMKYLLNSYKEKKKIEQVVLLNKIKLKDIYIEMDESYPKTLTNLDEYEYIQNKLNEIKKLSQNISKKYYYTIMNRVFLYKKLLYIENSNINKGLAEKELRKLINIAKSREEARDYYRLIDKIKNNKFIIKEVDRMFED